MSVEQDLAQRERDIRWPDRFQPETADMFVHNKLFVDAPVEKIWSHLIDVAAWPHWYPNSADVVLLGDAKQLDKSVHWEWSTFGMRGESWVTEFSPPKLIAWSSAAPGLDIAFYHIWHLRPDELGCLVTMEEVGLGADAMKMRKTDENVMHRGHDLWLATLKWVSESK